MTWPRLTSAWPPPSNQGLMPGRRLSRRPGGASTHLRLFGVVVLTVLMQLEIHHVPAAQTDFEVGPLTAADCP